ncbi:MAG: altronate dehydratase family protein, partial [Enterobacterales bacterium]|nr:altronate dehydratase family protein [Enterobacterales bacterium]
MPSVIKIHPLDNVAVALRDLSAGETLSVESQSIHLLSDIARGHKFALAPLASGDMIVKYGLPIGHALTAIAAGEHIHSQNAKTNLNDLDQYQYQPDFADLPAQMADRDVQIYRRQNGDVGIRNELWILPTVGCVNGMARQMLTRFLKETGDAEGIDGAYLFTHPFGCSQLGDDHINTRT